MRLKITLFLLFSSFGFLLQAQDYILNPSFEQLLISEEEQEHRRNQKYNTRKYLFIYDFEFKKQEIAHWYSGFKKMPLFLENNYKIHLKTNSCFYSPSYEGYRHLILKDNFLVYTPLAKKIEKGKKYRVSYFLSKDQLNNSNNLYFYLSIKLSKNRPELRKNNVYQIIKNKIPHKRIENVGEWKTIKSDTIFNIEGNPALWRKFTIEFIAEDDFNYLALQRYITEPSKIHERMNLDQIQLSLLEDDPQEKLASLAQQIQFETASAKLTQAAKQALDSLAIYLEKIPTTSFIQIDGHTDNQGQKAANLTLSKARAAAVKQYLINKNIKAEQLQTAGFGDTKPITTNDSPENRAKNRRVEIEYITKD